MHKLFKLSVWLLMLALPHIVAAQIKLVQSPPPPVAPQRELDCSSANTSAVVVTSVMLGGMAVPCYAIQQPDGNHAHQTFTANENWLDNLTITLLNRTNKTINDLTVTFTLPQTLRQGTNPSGIATISAYHLKLGRRPAAAQDPPSVKQHYEQPAYWKPLRWQSGTTITINLADLEEHAPERHDAVAERIRREAAQILGPDKAVTQVVIGGFLVTFDDGMHWNSGGSYLNPNLTPLPRDYFHGDINTPWFPR
jgi:hypothetical protein